MSADFFWKPFEAQIDSFDELMRVINELMSKVAVGRQQFVWRGQAMADWPLYSSLYRRKRLTTGTDIKEKDLQAEEHEILAKLHQWGLHSTAQNGRLSVLRQLAILQHYGAPTRLIDITFNAFVAAWFAVEQKWNNGTEILEDKDARLFAFDVSNRLINENSDFRSWEDDLFTPWRTGRTGAPKSKDWTESVFAWKASNLDGRIFAQNGGFLFGGVPTSTPQVPRGPGKKPGFWSGEEVRKATCLALRPHKFDATKGTPPRNGALYTFRITARAKQDIRRQLEQMFGYRHSTIYPDYTGFAQFGNPLLKSYGP
ncbi:FRG domain-containing protein [Duganella sp. FT134W]|uniref:FRG domain-containing protein n=1 Tax=Duganella margarita TaxID=2692170 RepID=A0A7X4GX77_9BURK|nr:FRG domain-containing protein [Duganella margarita]MYM71238.1 FRG domain-containing protein [Duganella margarita]